MSLEMLKGQVLSAGRTWHSKLIPKHSYQIVMVVTGRYTHPGCAAPTITRHSTTPTHFCDDQQDRSDVSRQKTALPMTQPHKGVWAVALYLP
jgi:hypothetical protein